MSFYEKMVFSLTLLLCGDDQKGVARCKTYIFIMSSDLVI